MTYNEWYVRLLQRLCRKELKKIASTYPHSRDTLIRYFDFMAIECINAETPPKERILGISLSAAKLLEDSDGGRP